MIHSSDSKAIIDKSNCEAAVRLNEKLNLLFYNDF